MRAWRDNEEYGMPALQERRLSLEEFHARYDGEKPYYEYWDGEAVQKSRATRGHSLIQATLVRLLDCLGFDGGHEITIKLEPEFELIPDVIAAEGALGNPYPTQPFEIAIEILSPEDSFSRVVQKCQMYERWGIRHVVVVDPQTREVWSFHKGAAHPADIIARRDDRTIPAKQLWEEVDRQLRP